MNTETVTIQGTEATATSPEGVSSSLRVDRLVQHMAPPRMDTGGVILPDGLKAVLQQGPMVIWVCQLSPRVASLRWIAEDSPAPFGPGVKYRPVRIALPYLCVLAVFAPGPGGALQLQPKNECFFRNEHLTSLNDELLYPALLNCSKFRGDNGHPLSWICTQHMDFKSLAAVGDLNERMRRSLAALLSLLWDTGYNRSSEHHEGQSWYGESVRRGVDGRIATVAKWEEATAADPGFALKVPWLPTGKTVRQVADHIFTLNHAYGEGVASADDVARIIHNHGK